jgi:hypothetical protein
VTQLFHFQGGRAAQSAGLNRRAVKECLADDSGNAGDTRLRFLIQAAGRERAAAIHEPAGARDAVGSASDGQ